MKITTRENNGVTILEPQGKITIGAGDVELREAVLAELDAGHTHLLMDLSGVSTMDSSGIGELVAAFTSVNNRGGKLKLLKLPPKITDILQITQLITVFEVFDDEAEAVASY